MAIMIAALLPVFLLIVLGFVLKRSLMRLETQWHGLERLTYYVLFPALLIQTLVKADLSSVRDCAGGVTRQHALDVRFGLPVPGEPHGLQRRGEVIEAVQNGGQPGRIAAIAEIAEQQSDRKHFAEEEPVILQMQRRPHQRRQQDGAGGPEKRFRPAAVEKAAREQFLRDRGRDAECDHQQPQRAIGARRFQHLRHESGRDQRVAIQRAARTAGSPIITESEIVRPPPTTWIAAAISIGPSCRKTNQATTASCPTDKTAKMKRPHSAVPQNFQIRGGGWVRTTGVSAAEPAVSRESIN